MLEPTSAAPSLPPEARILLSKDQLSCDLAGEIAIVNLKNGVYYGLDRVGARVWHLLQESMTVGEICARLRSEYDVEEARLEEDLRTFVTALAEQGLVDITP